MIFLFFFSHIFHKFFSSKNQDSRQWKIHRVWITTAIHQSSINSLVQVLPLENLVEKCASATVDECGRDCGWRSSQHFKTREGGSKTQRTPLHYSQRLERWFWFRSVFQSVFHFSRSDNWKSNKKMERKYWVFQWFFETWIANCAQLNRYRTAYLDHYQHTNPPLTVQFPVIEMHQGRSMYPPPPFCIPLYPSC